MNAVMSRPERVSTETHVERVLLRREGAGSVYAYHLMWEGTTIASTEVFVPLGADASVGLTQLLRAVSH